MKPRIVITMGDPGGIGPEILLRALTHPSIKNKSKFILVGSLSALKNVQRKVLKNRKFQFNLLGNTLFDFLDLDNGALKPVIGRPDKNNGYLSGLFVKTAVQLIQKGLGDALVTNPINKISFNQGGWGKKYIGHTEMLMSLTNTKSVAMLMGFEHLRAVFLTSHIPLSSVKKYINMRRIQEVVELTNMSLKKMGITHPRIAVCGLNPHAGDGGLIGSEEKGVIEPAIKSLKKKGIRVSGPYASDSLWPKVWGQEFDAGIAMYHDQGQIPVKLMSFKFNSRNSSAVGGYQMTLGLPFPRISVCHGTAFDIAGRGVASEKSLVDSIHLAIKMVQRV